MLFNEICLVLIFGEKIWWVVNFIGCKCLFDFGLDDCINSFVGDIIIGIFYEVEYSLSVYDFVYFLFLCFVGLNL